MPFAALTAFFGLLFLAIVVGLARLAIDFIDLHAEDSHPSPNGDHLK